MRGHTDRRHARLNGAPPRLFNHCNEHQSPAYDHLVMHDAVKPLRCDVASVIRVSVFGDVDEATAPDLRAVLQDVCGRSPDRLEVDLGGATFFSRAGLIEVVSAGQGLAGKLILLNADPAVRKLIDILGLDADPVQAGS